MRTGRPSRTAQHNALFRALESSLPEGRRLFDDPLAASFLGWELALVARLAALPGLRDLVSAIIDSRWPGVRSSVVARTRLIDEAIVARVPGAIEQLVILGAGFDSRAYRLPGIRGVRVFEVDHPDTQARKLATLERALPALPGNVRFVAIDFNRQELAEIMADAGYRPSAPTIFLWEGVSHYLSEAAVDATVRWCSRAARGSLLLFTYVHRDILTRPEVFAGSERLFASLRKVGERIEFGIEPEALPDFLAKHGLSLESDLGAAQYRERYYGAAARRMRGH